MKKPETVRRRTPSSGTGTGAAVGRAVSKMRTEARRQRGEKRR